MPGKPSLRTRGATAVLVAALTGGAAAGAAATTGQQMLPDLSAVSLSSLHSHGNPALDAAVSRVLTASNDARPLYYSFNS
jgi:hypothetical protein